MKYICFLISNFFKKYFTYVLGRGLWLHEFQQTKSLICLITGSGRAIITCHKRLRHLLARVSDRRSGWPVPGTHTRMITISSWIISSLTWLRGSSCAGSTSLVAATHTSVARCLLELPQAGAGTQTWLIFSGDHRRKADTFCLLSFPLLCFSTGLALSGSTKRSWGKSAFLFKYVHEGISSKDFLLFQDFGY